jgi:hypothetical protein
MAFESLLATDSLLGMITVLMTTLNINQSRTKTVMNKVSKKISMLGKYFQADIKIRNRLERKANIIFDKANIDISDMDAKINAQTELDLLSLEDYDFDD